MAKFRSSTLTDLHRLLGLAAADWHRGRKPETLRRYVLRYGAGHLRAVNEHERLWRLLTSETYRNRQITTFETYAPSLGAILDGLRSYVDRQGETPDDDARLCWLALRGARLAQRARSDIGLAFEWARTRPLHDLAPIREALRRIAVLDDEDFFKAALLLLWIDVDRQMELQPEARSLASATLVLNALEERLSRMTLDWSEFLPTEFAAWLNQRLRLVIPPADLDRVFEKTSSMGRYRRTLEASRRSGSFLTAPIRRHWRSAEPAADRRAGNAAIDPARAPQMPAVLAALCIDFCRSDDFDVAAELFEGILHRARATSMGEPHRFIIFSRAFSTALIDLARALVENGRGPGARPILHVALASALGVARADLRAHRLTAIAQLLVLIGDVEAAHVALEHALHAAATPEAALVRMHALSSIGAVFAELGRLDQMTEVLTNALHEAARLLDDAARFEAITRPAETIGRVLPGNLARATIEHGLNRRGDSRRRHVQATQLADLAVALNAAGDRPGASAVLMTALDAARRIDRIDLSVDDRDDAREFMRTEELAPGAQVLAMKAETLATVGLAMICVGQREAGSSVLDDACAAARRTRHTRLRSSALAYIARAFAATDECERAREIFREAIGQLRVAEEADLWSSDVATYVDLRAGVQAARAFAKRFPRSGASPLHFNRALGLVRNIADIAVRSDALAYVAAAIAAAGEPERALLVLRSNKHIDPFHCRTLVRLATAVAAGGSAEDAVGILENALEVARAHEEETRHFEYANVASGLAATAEVLTAAGAADRVHTLAIRLAGLAGMPSCSSMLIAAARGLSSAGYADRAETMLRQVAEHALGAAETVAHPDPKCHALSTAIIALSQLSEFAKAGDAVGQALAAARAAESDWFRLSALATVVRALIEAGDLALTRAICDELLAAASTMATQDSAGILASLGQALALSGESERARNLFERAVATLRSAPALLNVRAAVDVARSAVAAGMPQVLHDFMRRLEPAGAGGDYIVHEWREALLAYERGAHEWLRRSFLYNTVSTRAASDAVRMLKLAHLQAGDRDAAVAIDRLCPHPDSSPLARRTRERSRP